MKYVALLRGVNVGGANKVNMPMLKAAFEAAGMEAVRTYINSGNVLFASDALDRNLLIEQLQDGVRAHTGADIEIQLRDEHELATIVDAIPETWTNDATIKCDVVFLQPEVDSPETLEQLEPRPGIEDALYVPSAIIWRVDRADAKRSRLTRMVGTPLYRRVTVRNCNTTRKLRELLDALPPSTTRHTPL